MKQCGVSEQEKEQAVPPMGKRGVGSGMLSGAVRNGESGRGESSGGGEEGGKNGITLL